MSATRTFGDYGGRYVPETLIPALDELEQAWQSLRDDATFQAELDELRKTYAGRPTSLTLASRFAPDQLGPEALLEEGTQTLRGRIAAFQRASVATTISGGAAEIQRAVIARRELGFPPR